MGLTSAVPSVLVSVGTDHHPFGRLSAWVESWLAATEHPVRCLVQEGSSAVPRGAESLGLIPREELRRVISGCTVVVCHGAPGCIGDARQSGFVPIVVPRSARFGEHVDDHQVSFSRRIAALGWAIVVESEEDLHREIDAALRRPARVRRAPDPSPADETARMLGGQVDRLVGRYQPFYARRVPAALRCTVTTLRGIRV